MSEELIAVALRVLSSCCTAAPNTRIDPVDLTRLRRSVSSEKQNWEIDSLARTIVEQELKRYRARGAAA
jgi:hypothetical protein